MLPRIIKKIKQDRAWATIIALMWPAQTWFQQLVSQYVLYKYQTVDGQSFKEWRDQNH